MPRELTPRQAQILELVAAGLVDKEIAARLNVSLPTVRTHLQRLYREHGYRNRAEAAAGWTAMQHRPPVPALQAAAPTPGRRGSTLALGIPAAAVVGLLLLTAAVRFSMSLPIQRSAGMLPAPPSPSPTGAVRAEQATPAATPETTATPSDPVTPPAAGQPSAGAPPAPAPAPSIPPVPQVQAATAQLTLINRDRAAAGLPPLQWNACLAAAAGQVAGTLAAQGYLGATNGSAIDAACALGALAGAENDGYWSSIDDARMNTLFMSDPTQRARILGVHRYVGAAWATMPGRAAYLVVEMV